MTDLARYVGKLEMQTAQFEKKLDAANRKLGRFEKSTRGSLSRINKQFVSLGRGITGILAALGVGVGVAGFKRLINSAAEFGQTLDRMVGLAGVSREEIGKFRSEILKLSQASGRGPKELSEALYFIASSGAKGATALDILAKSAQAARAGLGETRTIADALTSAINAYGEENLNAAQATDALVAAVRDGKAEASDLASAISVVIPIASQLGVSFQDVLAGSAALTQIGASASQSTTAITGIFNALIKQTKAGSDALAEAGIRVDGTASSYEKLIEILRVGGLPALLAEVNRLFGDNIAQLSNAFGRVEGLTAILALTGQNAKAVGDIFDRVRNSTESLGTAVAAVADQPMDRMNRAMAEMEATSIRLGDAALPTVSKAFLAVADAIIKTFDAAERFNSRELLNLDVADQQQKIAALSKQLKEAREGGGGFLGLGGPKSPEVIAAIEKQLASEIALLDDIRQAVASNNPAIIKTVDSIVEQNNRIVELQRRIETIKSSATNPSRLNPFVNTEQTEKDIAKAQRDLDLARARLEELRGSLASLYEGAAQGAAGSAATVVKQISDGLSEITVPPITVPVVPELFGPTRADLGLPESDELDQIRGQLAGIEESALRAQGKIEEAIRLSAERQIESLRKLQRDYPAIYDEIETAITERTAQMEADIANAAGAAADKSSEFAQSFAAAFESRGMDALLNGDIHDAFQGFIKDIIELIFRITVLQPIAEKLESALGNIGKGGGGGLFGGGGAGITGGSVLSTIFGGLFGGGRAAGGSVSAGRNYLVGENGPELLALNTSGQVYNASQIGPGGVAVNQTIYQNIQAGVPSQWLAQMRQAGELTASVTYEAVQNKLRGRR